MRGIRRAWVAAAATRRRVFRAQVPVGVREIGTSNPGGKTMKTATLRIMAAEMAILVAAGGAIAQDQPVQAARSVDIRLTAVPPRIDGVIEGVWQGADSATGFVQKQPYEKTEPTERTVVYLLQDKENLYVAFRCHAVRNPPTANFTKDEDYVSIAFDPFGSKTTGYLFQVFGSGLFWDGLILDDGRDRDLTWEGVWSRAVKTYPDRMEVEMKIPFKTIRYRKGLSEWGLQFRRHIAVNFEDDYWTEVSEKDDDLVSRWGAAHDVAARSSGYYFELYPEGYVRYDDYRGEKAKSKPKGSLNLKWDLTSQTSLNATAYPDFAQIESDPFSVNLSRYPTYLQEQRPFFVEGREIFRFSSFPNSGFFQPLNTFYSRRIGKSVDGEAVPIIGGAKLTHKAGNWDAGALSAFTDSYDDAKDGIHEPARQFGVVRARRRVLANSDVGFLASGVTAGSHDYNYSIGAEGALRRGPSQLLVQGGMSNRNGKQGWAVSSGYRGFVGRFLTMGTYEAVGDSFDVTDIGFVPWAGRQRMILASGPFWTFRSGAVRNLYTTAGILRTREPGSPRWATLGNVSVNPNLRSNWGCNLEGSFGRNYEYDDVENAYVGYAYKEINYGLWGVLLGNSVNAGCNYAYGYNYQRHYLAWQGSNYLTASYSFASPVSTTVSSNLWVEWNPARKVVAMVPRFRPRVDYRITAYMTLSVFDEMVAYTEETHLAKSRLQSNRLGMLYTWNFAPKSWLYFAVNDYSALEPTGHPGGLVRNEMKQQYGIGAVKLKYLLYF